MENRIPVGYSDSEVQTPYAQSIEFWDEALDAQGNSGTFSTERLADQLHSELAMVHGAENVESDQIPLLALDEVVAARKKLRRHS